MNSERTDEGEELVGGECHGGIVEKGCEDEEDGVVRLMCSWQTTTKDVDDLVAALRTATG